MSKSVSVAPGRKGGPNKPPPRRWRRRPRSSSSGIIAAMAAATMVLLLTLSSSSVTMVDAVGYVRLCPLRHQPVIQLVRDDETGLYLPYDGRTGGNDGDGDSSGNSTANDGGAVDHGDDTELADDGSGGGGGARRRRRARDRSSTLNSGATPPQFVVEGRECPCASRYYCLMGDGDTCGIPRNGEAGGAVGCFELNSRTVFIRNAWPVVVLWYGALFIFLVATENGRNARHYCMSKMCKGRNRALAERIVRNEIQLRDRMRTAALAHQRRLFLTAVNADRQRQRGGNGSGTGNGGGDGERDVWANLDGRDDDAIPPPALVLKTKQYRKEEDAVYGLHRRGGDGDGADGEESPPPPPPLSSTPKTPTRNNLSDPPPVPPDTPDTVPNHASPSFDDDDDLDNFDDDDEVHTTCTICLAPVEDGDRVGVLKCRHVFHSDCLKDWIRRRNVCPLCQSPDVASPASSRRSRGARRGRTSDGDSPTDDSGGAEVGGTTATANGGDTDGSVAIRVANDENGDEAPRRTGSGSGPRIRTLVRARRLGVGSSPTRVRERRTTLGRRRGGSDAAGTTTASTSNPTATTADATRPTNWIHAWWPRRNGTGSASSSSAAQERSSENALEDGEEAVATGHQPSRTEEGRSED